MGMHHIPEHVGMHHTPEHVGMRYVMACPYQDAGDCDIAADYMHRSMRHDRVRGSIQRCRGTFVARCDACGTRCSFTHTWLVHQGFVLDPTLVANLDEWAPCLEQWHSLQYWSTTVRHVEVCDLA